VGDGGWRQVGRLPIAQGQPVRGRYLAMSAARIHEGRGSRVHAMR